MIANQPTIDFTAVKSRQQVAWSSGDYAVIGTTLAITGELLCEAVNLRPGQRVLDVAAGNGNATVVRVADVSRKITTNHNATVVRVADVSRKITTNHNATVVRACHAK